MDAVVCDRVIDFARLQVILLGLIDNSANKELDTDQHGYDCGTSNSLCYPLAKDNGPV